MYEPHPSIKLSEDVHSRNKTRNIFHFNMQLNPDFKWKSYIQQIAKDAGKVVGSLYGSSKYLIPRATVYIYES